MKTISLSFAALVAGLLSLCGVAAEPVALSLDPDRVNQLRVRAVDDDAWELTTLGEDPYVLLRSFDPAAVPPSHTVLAFDYFSPGAIDELEVFHGPPITAAQSLSAGPMDRAQSWQPFSVDLRAASSGRWTSDNHLLRLDFGRRSGVTLRIRNLQLREPNAAERRSQAELERVRQRKQTAADTVTHYLASEPPLRIESVAVDAGQITVTGRRTRSIRGQPRLIEAQPWQELWSGMLPVGDRVADTQRLTDAIVEFDDDRFTVSVPRIDQGRDRLTSRWGLVEQQPDGGWKLVSHYVYPTDLRAAYEHPDLDRKVASGLKGMGGVWANDILDELVELGVKHITDNIWISSAFSGEERPGWIAFEHHGRDWWVDPAFVDGHDRLIRFATDNGMVVSAIILVGFGDDGFAARVQHPDAVRSGQYAMPNLTSPEGAAAYEAAMFFLTRRYAQPGDPHGRISNWILHNEVDYGWEWTNMGEQPLAVYLDTYVRSMRITHLLARRFNPHARTFISLTHNWHKPVDPAWKTYAPKRMLELLARMSAVEGDFEWGVAYHPYPENLREPDAWNDTNVRDDFDTPLITPRNVAVLDRWMQRPEMLGPDGAPRGVVLSEQGFNTPDYSLENQRLQAAGFVYMWRQMRGLKTIEAFHNHRWIDHPREGGLLLGLRTLPEGGKPFGDRKFAWKVYQALDTPAESDATDFANDIILAD